MNIFVQFLSIFLILMLKTITSEACYNSSIQEPSPFMGNNGEIFKLLDGSIWKVNYEYEYLYEYHPDVIICPEENKLIIKDKSLNVERIAENQSESTQGTASIIESNIEGDFSGWEGDTIFKLENGQIWQQASYAYTYSYKYRPKVIIYNKLGSYEMHVEGMSSTITVKRLK